MTVQDLINELKGYNPDLEVFVYAEDYGEYASGKITSTGLDNKKVYIFGDNEY